MNESKVISDLDIMINLLTYCYAQIQIFITKRTFKYCQSSWQPLLYELRGIGVLLVRLVKTTDESDVVACRNCILHNFYKVFFKFLGFGSLPRRGAVVLQAALVSHTFVHHAHIFGNSASIE